MSSKKVSKKQLQEKQISENRRFNRILMISFSVLISGLMSILIFYTYQCDTRLAWRKVVWHGKVVPKNWICMNGDNLLIHQSTSAVFEDKTYYFCSKSCYNHLVKHLRKVAITPDAFSGDSINKSDAIIGLKEKGKPELVYFKNEQNFKNYYETNTSK